ncbi:penicillin-binding transpeptidase domain-containing protein [Methyloglobulus sp.]|uniref:peptidoglycan D,D-transpeptidase FtsI family protein n=1 Tax=Methyloglobulus sp. TaxID=2518622 RepID=UPI0032B7267D
MQILTNTNKPREQVSNFSGRRRFLLGFIMSCMLVLVGRAVHLQVFKKDFLQEHSHYVDTVSISSYRGIIKDRNGEALAISSPAPSIAINPKELALDDEGVITQMEKKFRAAHGGQKLSESQTQEIKAAYKTEKAGKIAQLEKLLDLPTGKVNSILDEKKSKGFAYLAKKISPSLAEQVKNLKLAGVDILREFKRFFPSGEVTAHLLGFTNAEDVGQVALEKSYEALLKGTDGKKRVIKDGLHQVIADVENIASPIPGKNLELSIDKRIQYLAYRELENAVKVNKAKSGALVVLDAKTGEILAAVNQPSFNPNAKAELKESLYRNRAFTEVFEPGSTVKPFTVAAALEGRYIRPSDSFDTDGEFPIGNHTVRDTHHYGRLTVEGVIKKSSNIGVARMALKMPADYFWGAFSKVGFGTSPATGFPGETSGRMPVLKRMHDFDKATLSFGYGLNTSALQLARAYTALADDGILHSVSLLKRDEDIDAQRVFTKKTAKTVRKMMESVITKDGTAYEARVDGYRVAGKTGTAKKAGPHGYSADSYFAVFAGLAPASDPRLVVVVMIDEPSAGQYYGGLVSAPVFSKVMGGALRLLGVTPDQENTMPILIARKN